MLNKNNERELAYVIIVNDIEPIQGSDNCECAIVGGWHIMVRKGEFKPGDVGIYFEIDSLLDASNPVFDFMSRKKYKVKTQKYTFGGKGNFVSQGLLMSAANFGWDKINPCGYPNCKEINCENCKLNKIGIKDNEGMDHFVNDESRFLTKQLGVTYYVPEDNKRKSNPVDPYKKMVQRNKNLFAHQPFRWLMKRDWGKKLLFVFFGKKRDNKGGWPSWVTKTDEERVQNMTWILEDKNPWVITEKIDGTSTTFTLKRGRWPRSEEFIVCSRNVAFDKPDKKCFYDTNVYTEMAEKYHIYDKMLKMLDDEFIDCEWITIQGETYGPGIQKRDYHASEHMFAAFNLVTSKDGRWGTQEMVKVLEQKYGIPCVPVLKTDYILPDTVDELLEYATGESVYDHELREGIVLRSPDGTKSFKAVSNEFLLKYHQ